MRVPEQCDESVGVYTYYNCFLLVRMNSLTHKKFGLEFCTSYAAINFMPNHPPRDKPPGHHSKGGKIPTPGTTIVYKNPPLGTKQGVKRPTSGT